MNYKNGDIFYESEDYAQVAAYCDEHGLTIEEINSDITEQDEYGNEKYKRKFRVTEIPAPTEQELVYQEIYNLKSQLAKYKEDVEQVELFGMERADYADKKKMCADMILRLRELERSIKEESDGQE